MKLRILLPLLGCLTILQHHIIALADNIEVTDYLNRSITLSKPASRIIGLAPHIIENLYSAGAGDKIVGAVAYSDYPESASRLPLVGSFNSINYESLLALAPDLIIMWHSGNGQKVLQQLDNLGLAVYVDEPQELADIARSITDLGALAGTTKTAEPRAHDYLQQIAQLRQQYMSQTRVTVLYQIWSDPLQTINGQHIINDVIKLCGGSNAFADAKSLAPKINLESVLQRNPDAIIASGADANRPNWLDDWKKWPSLNAVSRNNLYFIPPDLIQRHSLRILLGAETICRQFEKTRLSK